MKTEIISNEPVSQNFLPKPITKDQYVMGASKLPAQILMPTGHGWGKYLPIGETQFINGVDAQSCPAGGTLNAIEAIGRLLYEKSGFQSDLSERFTSIMMGMTGHGGNPHDAAEAIRKFGVVPEVFLPFNDKIDTVKKYFTPRPMSYELFKVGQNWLKKYEFGHEWLFLDGTVEQKRAKIKEALKYSPVGVSGYAWSLHSDGKYYKDGPDIHWFDIFDWVGDDYYLALDTYPPFVKKIDINYDFGFAKRYTLTRKLGAENVSDTPEEARLAYARYLVNYFLTSFLKKDVA